MLTLANSWSPVMWQQWFMLLFGNVIIGIIEGQVIARVFKANYVSTVLLMILANYTSMWAGEFVFGIGEMPSPIPDNVFDEPLYQVGLLLWIGIAVAIVMSIVIEWPVCLLAMRAGPGRLKRSILATLLAQASSYVCIGTLHFRATNTLGREVSVVRSMSIDPSLNGAEVWFVDNADGDVYSIAIDGTGRKKRIEANLTGHLDVMGIRSKQENDDQPPWQLVARKATDRDSFIILQDEVAGRGEPFRNNLMDDHPWPVLIDGWVLGTEGVADFRPPEQRRWKAVPRGNNGLRVEHPESNAAYDVSFDTVFSSWWGRCVTLLPTDLVVFELGQQVCLLDMPSRKITLLVRGRSPIVLFPG